MKTKLSVFLLFIAFVSCKTSNIAKVVSAQTLNDIKGKTIKVVEKRYSINDAEKKLTNERHIRFNANKQISTIVEYRAYRNIETGMTELMKMYELEYLYNGKKIMQVIESDDGATTETTTANDDDDDENSKIDMNSNIVKYSYVNKNTVHFQAFNRNTLDHTGTITINENFEVKEVIEYPKGNTKPITYNKKFNEALKLLEKQRVYYYNDELKKDKTSYTYEGEYMSTKTTSNYTVRYEYEFDRNGNWIKKSAKIKDNLIEVVTREIVYR